MQPLLCVRGVNRWGYWKETYVAARQRTKPTEILDLLSILACQRMGMGSNRKTKSVKVLKAAVMRTVSECIDKRFTILHTLLIGHEQVKLPRRTIIHKLVHYVLVQTGSTSKKAIEEGRCR